MRWQISWRIWAIWAKLSVINEGCDKKTEDQVLERMCMNIKLYIYDDRDDRMIFWHFGRCYILQFSGEFLGMAWVYT